MIATHVVRTLGVSAASGLVLRDGSFHIVADDENTMFVFKVDDALKRIALLPGELPAEHASRKARKPDFEILVDLRNHGLLAMGSGSRPTRERAVQVDGHERTRVIDTSLLCAHLRETFPELNLEGGVLLADDLVLLQRGNRNDRRNALIFIAKDNLQRALVSLKFVVTRTPPSSIWTSADKTTSRGPAPTLPCSTMATCWPAPCSKTPATRMKTALVLARRLCAWLPTVRCAGTVGSTPRRKWRVSPWTARPYGWSATPTIVRCSHNCCALACPDGALERRVKVGYRPRVQLIDATH